VLIIARENGSAKADKGRGYIETILAGYPDSERTMLDAVKPCGC
jgi:hypothetical protein